MIRSFYEYIFLNLFQWSVKVNGETYYHVYSASLIMSLLICINITTMFSIVHIFTSWSLPNPNGLGIKLTIVVLAILIFMANYTYFSYKDRGLKIVEHYRVISGCCGRAGYITRALLIGSLAVLFSVWFVGLQLSDSG